MMSMGYGSMVLGHGWLSGGGNSGAGGKSAVQLLQESKSRYVKSDRVLVSRQEPSRPDHLQISANPNIFLSAPSHTLHVSRPTTDGILTQQPPTTNDNPTSIGSNHGSNIIVTNNAAIRSEPPPVPPRTHVAPLTSAALAQHLSSQGCGGIIVSTPPPLPTRSPRATPRLRAKTQPVSDAWPRGGDLRRSLSHGPADRGNSDVQMKLRRLLNTDSKESLNQDHHQRIQNGDGTFRAEVAAVTTHKSLPELTFQISPESPASKLPCERRPSCPGFLAFTTACVNYSSSIPPVPPPRPPRRNKDSSLPSPKPPPRPPPPKILPRFNHGDDSGVSLFSNIPSSDDFLSMGEDSDLDPEETRRRPILRSKSDVTHERNGGMLGAGVGGANTPGGNGEIGINGNSIGASNPWGEVESSRRSSYCSAEVEQFFDSMGLDNGTLKLLDNFNTDENSNSSSPPVYFDDISSDESGGGCKDICGGASSFLAGRRASSDSDDIKIPFNTSGLTAAGMAVVPSPNTTNTSKRGGEPSIVEKNARVIKWLFNCQKARSVAMPRSLSSGS